MRSALSAIILEDSFIDFVNDSVLMKRDHLAFPRKPNTASRIWHKSQVVLWGEVSLAVEGATERSWKILNMVCSNYIRAIL